MRDDARPSPLAGQWYPGHPRRLAAAVDGYVGAARSPAPAAAVVALVAPHAGYRYSGAVAGEAFAAVRGQRPALVAVVGPMHASGAGPVLTSGHSAYLTPLGAVPVDAEAARALDATLRRELGLGVDVVRNDGEHSVEMELPFLQRVLAGPFALLPLMVRADDARVVATLGCALGQLAADRATLLVASTDLSHHYPQRLAAQFDEELLRRVTALDPESVLGAEAEGTGFACGIGALAAVLWAARTLGADDVRVLRHATSGDITGDYGHVVGYAAAAVTRSGGGSERLPHAARG
jgi:hypothetical protein